MSSRAKVPASIWVLGMVSMLMDISSEMVHSLLPLFMVGTLGASAFMVGLIEGVAESTTLIVKVFSGTLSDRMGRRKPLALLGYGLAAASKPLFALAGSLPLVMGARFIDRIGKGIRGAPRDALIADLTPKGLRGAAFGLRQSLDTIGAVTGPLIAIGLMLLWAGDFRAVFWVAGVPGALAVLLLMFGIREPIASRPRPARAHPLSRAQLALLGRAFWRVAGLGALFTLARFSEAFLLLRAQQAGFALALVPLALVTMNIVYSLSAWPFGALADRMPPHRLLAGGLLVLIAADIVLARGEGKLEILVGVGLWGLHLGMTQGLLAALVADAAPTEYRGTAFGVFNLVCGLATLLASVVAGLLWDSFGAGTTFVAGAGIGVLALVLLALQSRSANADQQQE